VPACMHALDSLESIPNRFGDFYFSTNIKILGKFLKIHDLDRFRLPSVECLWSYDLYQERELEKSRNMMPGGAIGATESRNKLGMLVVMSLQLSMPIGGT